MKNKIPRHRVSIQTVEQPKCCVCDSTDVFYRIGYRDLDHPETHKAGFTSDNRWGYSCQTHVLEATKHILTQAGVLPEPVVPPAE